MTISKSENANHDITSIDDNRELSLTTTETTKYVHHGVQCSIIGGLARKYFIAKKKSLLDLLGAHEGQCFQGLWQTFS